MKASSLPWVDGWKKEKRKRKKHSYSGRKKNQRRKNEDTPLLRMNELINWLTDIPFHEKEEKKRLLAQGKKETKKEHQNTQTSQKERS